MEPITPPATDELSDAQLWGSRPILWGLRMLEPDPAGMIEPLSRSELREASGFLGLDLPIDAKSKVKRVRLATDIGERLRAVSIDGGSGGVLYANLRGLQEALGLNRVDLDLIAFRAMLRLHPGFEALAGKYIGLCCDFVFHRRLAHLFGCPARDVTAALASNARLVTRGLLSVAEGVLGPLERRLRLLPGLISPLVDHLMPPGDMLRAILPAAKKPHLALVAYPHLAREIKLLVSHLRISLDRQSYGTNVLLCGPPGVGKTELAATLAATLRCQLYPEGGADEDGESFTPRRRLIELMQLQKLVRIAGGGIILVDEAEDLFPTVWSDAEKTPTKAAVNECLEANPVPTIWISNRTAHMDAAFLRRFDLVIQVPSLPASSKRALLEKSLPAGVLDENELRRYATQRELSPAMIARISIVATSGGNHDVRSVRANLQVLSSHYLKTLGATPPADAGAPSLLKHDLRLINSNPPLEDVVRAMTVGCFGARMLLHGLPGTGKTAFCKAMAESLDKPLLQKQASSLLSCYVGDTEKNIREMFDEARQENGVLLLDEAESFLRSRDHARARWEVTQTNELLTQMEAFGGFFVCTTNRLDDLDPAALRRFDFKVEFQPLRPEQGGLLIRQCCAALGMDAHMDEDQWIDHARRLNGLTPGDAATVLRRLRLLGCAPTITMLLDALAEECRYKPGAPKPIGFVH